MEGFQVDNTKAQCLLGTAETNNFNNYLNQCRSAYDNSRANTFFSANVQNFKQAIQFQRATFDNGIVAGDSAQALADLAGATVAKTNETLKKLNDQKAALQQKLDVARRQMKSAERTFLDEIMNDTPKESLTPQIQDMALLVFWFSWALISVILVFVRMTSPGGGLKAGGFTFVIMLLLTLLVQGVMQQVA